MSKLLVFVGQLALTKEQAAVVLPVLMTPGVLVQSQYVAGLESPVYVEDEAPVTVFHLKDSEFLTAAEWEAKQAAQATIPHGQENS